MNTCRINLLAAQRGNPSTKRRRTGNYHESAPVDDRFEDVRLHDETVGSRKTVRVTEQVSHRQSSWAGGDTWLPEDSVEFGLRDSDEWFDEEDITSTQDEAPILPELGVLKKRSQVSVNFFYHR